MARVLIVGGGCRGRSLAGVLAQDGLAVRVTTRDAANAGAIETAGAEPYVGDPDRVGTLMDALAGVTIACWLLGTAAGEPGRVAALHGTRLRFFLEKVVDTPVRGVVYEAAGTAGAAALAAGVRELRSASETWQIPVQTLTADPRATAAWVAAARAAIARLLAAPA